MDYSNKTRCQTPSSNASSAHEQAALVPLLQIKRKTMNAKKIVVAAALLLGATSAALAQSAWTTGTAADRAQAGYVTPSGGGLYAYAPNFGPPRSSGLNAYAMVPQTDWNGIARSAAAQGGGSLGYNESLAIH
jgi:hypothetical protein